MEVPEQTLSSPWRLRWYPRLLAGALGLAFAGALAGARGSVGLTGRLGGDLPAFVGAGRLVARGEVAQLYDWSAQAAAQVGLHGSDTGDFLAFAYPPFVAAAYVPLTWLPWPLAVGLHALVMAGALGLAARLVSATRGRPLPDWIGALSAALLFLPLMRAVTGGQNTSLSLLGVALCWWGLDRRRETLAGLGAGLLLFKPQLALPLLGLLLVGRRWRALGAAAGVGALYWLAGVAVAGRAWLPWWWGQIATFHGVDQAVNAANSVGLLGLAEALLGPGEPLALALGASLALGPERVPLSRRMGLAAGAMILVPPHAMSYDAGLAILVLWALYAHLGRPALPGLLGLGGAALLGLLAPILGFNPLAGVVVVAWAWCAWQGWRALDR